ncbi:MAG: ABC transporter ATP-binding protein [Spirochaetes bacterium]|nr:ABC transporter ATP-binding protein [Spirochaetota bacterium]
MFLNVNDLSAGYGDLIVLREISFSLNSGETLAIIGPNGAGKTTLLWTLSGLLKPKTGQILYNENDITGLDPSRIVKTGIGHVIEGMHVFSTLCVEDNLMLGSYGEKNKNPEKLQTVYKYFPVLKNKRKQQAGSLSGGEKQMLSIGRTLMRNLKLLLLDEPSAGLAPLLVDHLFEILTEMRREMQISILLVEQNAEAALHFANRGLILAQGKIKLEGNAKDLLTNEDVKDIYLGRRAVKS